MSGRTQDAPAGVKAAQARSIQDPALAGMLAKSTCAQPDSPIAGL